VRPRRHGITLQHTAARNTPSRDERRGKEREREEEQIMRERDRRKRNRERGKTERERERERERVRERERERERDMRHRTGDQVHCSRKCSAMLCDRMWAKPPLWCLGCVSPPFG
jgi:hypothetical protein